MLLFPLTRTCLTDQATAVQTPDLDGDEEDGYDEVIYPVDFRQAGHIVDDEMHAIMYVSRLSLGLSPDLQRVASSYGQASA